MLLSGYKNVNSISSKMSLCYSGHRKFTNSQIQYTSRGFYDEIDENLPEKVPEIPRIMLLYIYSIYIYIYRYILKDYNFKKGNGQLIVNFCELLGNYWGTFYGL